MGHIELAYLSGNDQEPAMSLLREMLDAAIAAAQPATCLSRHLPPPPVGQTVIVGAGKAAAAMAKAVEQNYSAHVTGLVTTQHGYQLATDRIVVVEAAHPIPDRKGVEASRRILELVSNLEAGDLVLCLLSGGGSALMCLPAPGLTLEDKQSLTHALLIAGAPISDINCVRRHLSSIKGGRLALAAQPARVVTLAISDVPDDDPLVIASGPTVRDHTTYADARSVLDRFDVQVPASVARHLKAGKDERNGFAVDYRLIARPRHALDAAAILAVRAGFELVDLGDALEGDARLVGQSHAALARRYARDGKRVAILSGGELTSVVRGEGTGGPNHEYALALAIALDGMTGISAIAADTDGLDGSSGAAGAEIDDGVLGEAQIQGLEALAMLEANNSGAFFATIGQQIVTGPTYTNVNDFRAILVEPN